MAGRALCIGINQFRDRQVNALRGCVPDARGVAALLTGEYGFAGSDVRLVLDAQGTKAGIVDGLQWLTQGARSGDHLVLFVSSHGTHIPCMEGDESDDEDEVLVVHDHDWERVILTDDELARHIARVPQGVTLTSLFDTCHSGTMNDTARDRARAIARRGPSPQGGYARGVSDVKGRYLEPPWRRSGVPPHHARSMVRSARSAAGDTREADTSHVASLTLAACGDDQTAADASFGGAYAGAFTHSLLACVAQNPGATWDEVFQATKRKVSQGGFDQTPEIHGPTELRRLPVFGGGRQRSGRPGVTAQAAGAAMGLSTNSPEIRTLDQQIGQLEASGDFANAARALHARAARVHEPPEKVRTLEHLVSLYRTQLHDERGAMRACEEIVAVDRGHTGAKGFLEWAYANFGETAKLQALRQGAVAGAKGAPAQSAQQEQGGGIFGSISTAFASAAAAAGAAATGVAGAIEQSNANPQWMQESQQQQQQRPQGSAPQQQPARPATKPTGATAQRCPYCGADAAPSAKACGNCGGNW